LTEAVLSSECRVAVDSVLEEVREKTARMSALAGSEDWEELLEVVRARDVLIGRCVQLECAPEEKHALILAVQSLIRDDPMLIERCASEREAIRNSLAVMGRAQKASQGYQFA